MTPDDEQLCLRMGAAMGWTITIGDGPHFWIDENGRVQRPLDCFLTSADAQWAVECEAAKRGVHLQISNDSGPCAHYYTCVVAYFDGAGSLQLIKKIEFHDSTPSSMLAARGRAMMQAVLEAVEGKGATL